MDSKQLENYQPESSEELADVRLQQAHGHHQELVELLDTLIESNSKQGLEDFFDILIEQNAQLTKALTEKDDQAVIDAIKSIDATERLSEVQNAIVEALNKETDKDDNQLVKIITELVTELKNKPEKKEVEKVEVTNQKEVKFPEKFKVEVTNQVEFPESIDITQPKWYSAFSYDKLKLSLKEVFESITLKIKSEKPLEVNILDSKGKIIDDFSPIIRQNINGGGGTSGGGGFEIVGVKNGADTRINPATEETQADVLAAIQALGGTGQPIETLAGSYNLVFGNLISGTIASTFVQDGVDLILGEDSSNGLTVDLNFIVSGGKKAENFGLVGSYRGGASHYVDVQAYNYVTLGFDTISTAINRLNNQVSDQTYDFPLTADHTDMSGNCQIRLVHQVTTYNSAHRLYLDHVNVYYSVAGATKLQNSDNVIINPATEEKQLPDNHQVSVSNFPATQPISGSVAISNFPVTQPVSIATMPTTPVTGTFWQATQPVSATSLPLPAGAATETTLSAGAARLKKTVALASSGTVHTPASGKKIRIYNMKFSLSADMTDVAFKFASGSAFEKFLAPKSGGLYGTNLHPNFHEGTIDQALNCDITGTGTVQINLDYIEI